MPEAKKRKCTSIFDLHFHLAIKAHSHIHYGLPTHVKYVGFPEGLKATVKKRHHLLSGFTVASRPPSLGAGPGPMCAHSET